MVKIFLFMLLLLSCGTHKKEKQIKYAFIDVGSATGASVNVFRRTRLYLDYPWQIYAIEPSPDFYPQIEKREDVEVIPKAAWTYDGKLRFFKTLPAGETANSVYYVEGQNKEEVVWDCFHFGNWLKKNFTKDDVVIMSMDIAGGEPELLESMIEDGSIDLIDRAYVEFSIDMLAEENSKKEDMEYHRAYTIANEIRARGIYFDFDSAEDVIEVRSTWIDTLDVTPETSQVARP